MITLPKDDAPALTVTAPTGHESQIVSTRGAFSFRIGNLFAGQDREVMRVSTDGNLSVPGTFKATKGIEFADGTVQTTGLSGRKDKGGNIVPNASGSGTQGRLAKWTDNAGTLGDSVAIDTGTELQLTAAPSNQVDTNVLFTSGNDRTAGIIASATPSFVAQNGPYFALRGNQYTTFANQRGIFAISAGNVSSPGPLEGSIKFLTGNDQLRMFINNAGNVGIGNAGPTFRLHIVDTANTGLRVTTNTSGGTVASFGGNGDFQIDAVNVPGGRLTVKEGGNVGIGLPANGTPQAKLDVRGDVKLGSTGQLFAPGGEENLRIIRGFFDDGGNINAGQGFTVSTSPSLLGTYFVTFNTPFSGVPAVTATCEDVGGSSGSACIASIFGVGANSMTIDVFDDAGNSVDSQVLFIAIGPR
ncbi:MAG: hypothetical protein DMF64_19950 [Acidobacteria bacterium]|nr:MAG: hypothetical protein DMF64_19950 [Acidobacteriota bacterium]